MMIKMEIGVKTELLKKIGAAKPNSKLLPGKKEKKKVLKKIV